MKIQTASCIGLILFCGSSLAADQQTEDETPSIELLEFLGSWETENGRWVDPKSMTEWADIDEQQTVEVKQDD